MKVLQHCGHWHLWWESENEKSRKRWDEVKRERVNNGKVQEKEKWEQLIWCDNDEVGRQIILKWREEGQRNKQKKIVITFDHQFCNLGRKEWGNRNCFHYNTAHTHFCPVTGHAGSMAHTNNWKEGRKKEIINNERRVSKRKKKKVILKLYSKLNPFLLPHPFVFPSWWHDFGNFSALHIVLMQSVQCASDMPKYSPQHYNGEWGRIIWQY